MPTAALLVFGLVFGFYLTSLAGLPNFLLVLKLNITFITSGLPHLLSKHQTLSNMENRKTKLSKILTHFDALADEKLALEENLDLLFGQLNPYIDFAKRNEFGTQQHLNNILKYELKLLKKLTELNSDLEGFLEDKSDCKLQLVGKSLDCINNAVDHKTGQCHENIEHSEVESKTRISSEQLEPCLSQRSQSNVSSTEMNESSMTIIPFEFSDSQIDNELPENDIQNLRNCLKNFSDKLGLNQQSFSNMEDYYDKPTASCVRDSQIDQAEMNVLGTTSDEINAIKGYDIPVRDTLISSQLNDDGDDPKIEQMCSEIPKDSFVRSDPLGKHESISESSLCGSIGKSANDLKRETQIDFHSTVADIYTKHNGQRPCSTSKPKNNYSSALMKLSSYKSKLSNDNTPEIAELPDISLKPTKTNIPSDSKKINSKNCSQLTRHKKKENAQNLTSTNRTHFDEMENTYYGENTFYEPVRKKPPTIGDECAISHIESPSEFYIHVDDEATALIDSLTEQINEYFNRTVSPYNNKHAACGDVGNFCFSYIPDYMEWYRVEVLDWYLLDDTEDVIVQLVDYGNVRKTSYKNLRKMIKEIGEIPLLAIRCHFPLMYPYGSSITNKITDWPEIAVEALIDLTANNGMQNMFKVVYAREESHSVAIDLLNQLEENRRNTLGQILLDVGLAVQIDDVTQ